MSSSIKFWQILLTSLYICFFVSQVHASFADEAANQANSSSEEIVIYPTGTPNGDLDIIGLRIGMSPSQAESILKAYRDDFKITVKKAYLSGEFRILKKGERVQNKIPETDYIKRISASNLVNLKGTHVDLYFSPPPAKNQLMYIKRETYFQQTGPTVADYNKGFIEKYGDNFYSIKEAAKQQTSQTQSGFGSMIKTIPNAPENNNDTRVIRLNLNEQSSDKENFSCYQDVGNALLSLPTISKKINVNEKCGLILASEHRGNDNGVLNFYKMTLIDFNEWVKYHEKKVALIQDNNNKIKQQKLKAASERETELF